MRFLLFFLLLIGLTVPAWADMNSAIQAYERGNYQRAFQEFQRLADQGRPDAQYRLGQMYVQGEGTIQDYIQAHKWLNLASSQDHRQAQRLRDEIAERMTAEQLAEAQRQARAWQAKSREPEVIDDRRTVSQVQKNLNRLGYDAGPPDGRMGAQTRSAIRAYQREHDMVVTGELSPALIARLQAMGREREVARPRQPDRPRWEQVVHDGFKDGNYTRDPSWKVARGEFWVESGGGLRSTVTPPRQLLGGNGEVRPGDIGVEVLGMVLERVLRPQGQGQQPPLPGAEPAFAEIYLDRSFAEPFRINLQLVSRQQGGALELGPYRGRDRDIGYRLFYLPGAVPGLEMVQFSEAGNRVIASYDQALSLEDGRRHTLQWTRHENGEMIVHLDGRELLRTADRSLRGNFRGFTWINRGGDYTLSELSIMAGD